MIELYPDFFNDVFGPLMQPGSSSHTAGPCRLGYIANCLLGEEPKDILVRMDERGSFAGIFGYMNEDVGMAAGALGYLPDDIRLFSSREICAERGISLNFEFCRLEASRHPNAVEFVLTGVSGKRAALCGISTGGGMVDTVSFDAADRVGRSLGDDCHCTGRGGLCSAPAARGYMEAFNKRRGQK